MRAWRSFCRLLTRFTREPARGADFGARVFKISRDAQGTRLTLPEGHRRDACGRRHCRLSGESAGRTRPTSCGFTPARSSARSTRRARASVVRGHGPVRTPIPGRGSGPEADGEPPVLQPRSDLPACSCPTAQTRTPSLPEAARSWRTRTRMLRIVLGGSVAARCTLELMGEVQLEILQRRHARPLRPGRQRSARAAFVYRETIAAHRRGRRGTLSRCATMPRCICCWSPPRAGSGVQLCRRLLRRTMLDRNWQRLILTHLAEQRASRRADRRAAHRYEDHAGGWAARTSSTPRAAISARRPTAPCARG